MEITKAAETLGISLPATKQDIKSAYRTLAHFCHPDKGGKSEKFMEIEEAYRVLQASPEAHKDLKERVTHTVDGKALSDLGNGFPLYVSAKTCETCSGNGYIILHEKKVVNCQSCKGTGLKRLDCKYCNGTGKIKEKHRCVRCKGTGDFFPRNNSQGLPFFMFFGDACPVCCGTGLGHKETEETLAMVCDECKGIGEIKLFNAVLPRGLLR